MKPSGSRRKSRRRERWPPPDPISKPGRIAGYTTAGCLVVTSGAFLVASWDDLVCTHDCPFPPGLAALVWFIAAPIGLAGLAIARRVSLRPTQSDGPTLDSFARDPLLGRHCSGGNASPEFHLSGRTSRPKFSAVHRGEWPFQRSLELDLAEGTDCNPGLDDRNRFTAAQACLPSRSSRRHRLAVRIRLAPSRYRSSWGTSLVELRPAG